MKIKGLEFKEFVLSMLKVHRILSDEERCDGFLDKAMEDMPVIEDILRHIARLKSQSASLRNKESIASAYRDLVVLLALYQLEKAQAVVYN